MRQACRGRESCERNRKIPYSLALGHGTQDNASLPLYITNGVMRGTGDGRSAPTAEPHVPPSRHSSPVEKSHRNSHSLKPSERAIPWHLDRNARLQLFLPES